jgi:hypothetical protein
MKPERALKTPDAERLAASSEGSEIHWTGLAIAAFCFFVAVVWAVAAGGWWYLWNFPNWGQINLRQNRTKIGRQRPTNNDAKAERA